MRYSLLLPLETDDNCLAKRGTFERGVSRQFCPSLWPVLDISSSAANLEDKHSLVHNIIKLNVASLCLLSPGKPLLQIKADQFPRTYFCFEDATRIHTIGR